MLAFKSYIEHSESNNEKATKYPRKCCFFFNIFYSLSMYASRQSSIKMGLAANKQNK